MSVEDKRAGAATRRGERVEGARLAQLKSGLGIREAVEPLGESRHHGFDRQKQNSTVCRMFNELGTSRVEALCLIALGVNQHGADPDVLGGDRDAPQGVREKIGTEPLTAMAAIDREAPDDRDRDRIWRVAADLPRRGRALDGSGGDAKIRDNTIVFTDDVRPGESAFVLQGVIAQPIVQSRFATIEGGEIVLASERNRSRK
jgi:hypothetical protein